MPEDLGFVSALKKKQRNLQIKKTTTWDLMNILLWEELKSVEAVVFPACVSVHTCLVPKEKRASDPLQPSLSQMA